MYDRLFQKLCFTAAIIVPVLLFAILIRMAGSSAEVWETFGFQFLFSSEWNPQTEQFGAFPAILGTLLTTGIAMFFAVPLSFLTAFFLNDAPDWLRRPLSQGLDLLAAIPSVIYGIWGLFILVPVIQKYVQPFLLDTLGLRALPFMGTDANGFGYFTAGIVLTLMILPYISAVMRDVFRMTPTLLRESAYGIGCTRWETARDIILPYGLRGFLGGVFIGLGRALGETMAVLFIIGNVMRTPTGIFDSGTTIAATLANNFAEADGLMRSSLFALGLILLVLAFLVQIPAQYYLAASRRERGEG
ncbi:MAG: phosphate ABC transporter permease subunit PstC [Planctomycetia bacterium]|nr:phosphate ABC transporter permease subunit PstC [Planctomycetia bacterium]